MGTRALVDCSMYVLSEAKILHVVRTSVRPRLMKRNETRDKRKKRGGMLWVVGSQLPFERELVGER